MTQRGTLVVGRSPGQRPLRIRVQPNDLASLRAALEAIEVPSEDVDEITAVVSQERPSEAGLGERAAAWVGRMVARALTGAWAVGKCVSSDVFSDILCRYYGLRNGNPAFAVGESVTAEPAAESEPVIDDVEFWQEKTAEELAAEQGVKPIQRLEEIWGAGADLWDSEEEFETFLQSIRRPRTEQ